MTPRQREFDLGLAACAAANWRRLWTLNARDYRGIPGLSLVDA